MIRVISVIRVPLMRSLLRTPIAGPYTQLITDLRRLINHLGNQTRRASPAKRGSELRESNFGSTLSALLVAARRHDFARGGPLGDVLTIDGGGHQFRKQIGSAGERRNYESREGRGDVMSRTLR